MITCILFACVATIYAQKCFLNTNVTSGTDLLHSYVIYRHGERAPLEESISLLGIPKVEVERKIYSIGYGGITNEGKRRGYCIGEILRQRYDGLLSNIYFEDQISITTTSKTRTKMTALTAMAALYPPTPAQKWCRMLNWQPIPYSMLPPDTSFLEFFYNCPYYLNNSLYHMDLSHKELKPYSELLSFLERKTGVEFFKFPMKIYEMHNVLDSLVSVGIELPSWVPPIRSDIAEVASVVLHAIFNTEKLRQLSGGVFFYKFLETAASVIAGKNVTERVTIFSAHDLNVAAVMATAGVPYHLMKYGAFIALELHRVRESGKYVVIPIYVSSPGETSARVLPIHDCHSQNKYCDFDTFKFLVNSAAITEDQYSVKCNKQ